MIATKSKGTISKNTVSVIFSLPTEEEVNDDEFGTKLPEIIIRIEENALIYHVDSLALFKEAAIDADSAEAVAGWLEMMAEEVRSKIFT